MKETAYYKIKFQLFVHISMIIMLIIMTGVTQADMVEDNKITVPFAVSSPDNESSAIVGSFKGELQIYPKSIKIILDRSTIEKRNLSSLSTKEILIRSIKLELGEDIDHKNWRIMNNGQRYEINKAICSGEIYELPRTIFVLPRQTYTNLSNKWIIVTIEVDIDKNTTESIGYCDGDSGNKQCLSCVTHFHRLALRDQLVE